MNFTFENLFHSLFIWINLFPFRFYKFLLITPIKISAASQTPFSLFIYTFCIFLDTCSDIYIHEKNGSNKVNFSRICTLFEPLKYSKINLWISFKFNQKVKWKNVHNYFLKVFFNISVDFYRICFQKTKNKNACWKF